MYIKNQFRFYFLSLFTILIISFVVMYPSFGLAFQDDDWRGVVLPRSDYAGDSRLFTPYGIQLWFCGFLYNLFDSNFHYYYILAFVFRSLVAAGVLIFLYILTKNRLASFLGSLFVAVSFSGIQTTFEPANMNVYLSVAGHLIFLIAFFLSLEKFSIKYLLVMVISLLLATLSSPVRTYPLYAWVIITEGLLILIGFSKHKLKIVLTRQLLIVAIFLYLYSIGIFSWFSLDAPAGNKINNFSIFLTNAKLFLENLSLNIFSNFLKGLGNIFLPSTIDKSGSLSIITATIYLVSLFLLLFLSIKKRSIKLTYSSVFFLWPLLFYSGYFIVVLNGYGHSGQETLVFESFRRYLFPPMVGFSISLGLILSLILKRSKKLGYKLSYLFIILIIIHAAATNIFLNDLSKLRDGPFMRKIWNQLVELVPLSKLDQNKLNVFYFETDGSPRAIYTVNDGFILHTTTVYKINQGQKDFNPTEINKFTKMVINSLSFQEFVSFMQKGSPYDNVPITWDRVFAFRVEGERLVDIKGDLKTRVEPFLEE